MDTSATGRDHDVVNRELRAGLPALAGVLAFGAGHVAITLMTASGVTQTGPTSYYTEFGNPEWWMAGFLLAIPVALASWLHPKLTTWFIIAALIPECVLPQLVVQRAVAAGWGDPMLSFGYLYPAFMVPLFIVAGSLGRRSGTRRSTEPAV
jgi:hypothetical protein